MLKCVSSHVSQCLRGRAQCVDRRCSLRIGNSIFPMFAKISWIVATALLLFCICVNAEQQQSTDRQLVSHVCLGCMCEVISGCNTTIGCRRSECGPFAITWGYWDHGGKPTLNNEPLNDHSFERCVNDPYCATIAIQGYMTKFGRDCTGDGLIDCDDYLRIHRLGPNGCTKPLNRKNENTYNLCTQTFGRQ